MTRAMLILIRAYQLVLSPLLPPACRFYPTCSEYAREALEEWGFWHGMGMSLKRLARCHPLGGHGFDPVPISRCRAAVVESQVGRQSGSLL